jgi:hypothetical protein
MQASPISNHQIRQIWVVVWRALVLKPELTVGPFYYKYTLQCIAADAVGEKQGLAWQASAILFSRTAQPLSAFFTV